ncbi:hypothetical protein QYE76_003610 [Lolium multiflorum]|uniref:Uncharacterized protein n=1 Tax=Lolium multiflorum TaxID=4521 RepID=A0AAD8VYZ9_LOLMU|nr:hypothetical protein QYE76_003610 [Lolium multiflorum]
MDASGRMMALLLLGLLNGAFLAPAARSHSMEVNNQVLNALFTLMSLYQHPTLVHHPFLLCRWRLSADAVGACLPTPPAPARRREPSMRGRARAHGRPRGAAPPHRRLPARALLALLVLRWEHPPRARRDGFTVAGVPAPVIAVVYTMCSPLESDPSGDLDAP